jgi:hypothetical protein
MVVAAQSRSDDAYEAVPPRQVGPRRHTRTPLFSDLSYLVPHSLLMRRRRLLLWLPPTAPAAAARRPSSVEQRLHRRMAEIASPWQRLHPGGACCILAAELHRRRRRLHSSGADAASLTECHPHGICFTFVADASYLQRLPHLCCGGFILAGSDFGLAELTTSYRGGSIPSASATS